MCLVQLTRSFMASFPELNIYYPTSYDAFGFDVLKSTGTSHLSRLQKILTTCSVGSIMEILLTTLLH